MQKNIFVQWSQVHHKFSTLDGGGMEAHGSGAWSPNTDVYENRDEIVVKMELAGVLQESLHIYLQNDRLTVEGVRRDPYGGESTDGYRFRQMEIEYGPFQRVIPMPASVDGGKARADFLNGVLKVHLPRAQSPMPRKIKVIMGS